MELLFFFKEFCFKCRKYSLLYDCKDVGSIRIPGFLKGIAMHDPKEVDHFKLQLSLQREGSLAFGSMGKLALETLREVQG